MINFFRKIRHKLADNNQFFKYSRYAIGEIALVVIGILIALGINDSSNPQLPNWNKFAFSFDIDRFYSHTFFGGIEKPIKVSSI